MAPDDVLTLVEVVALALPAYALVLKTIADQPSHYPPQAVDGLAAAMVCVLLAGMALVGSLLYHGLPPAASLGALLLVASFVSMLYAMRYFASRQEELEGGIVDDEKGPGSGDA